MTSMFRWLIGVKKADARGQHCSVMQQWVCMLAADLDIDGNSWGLVNKDSVIFRSWSSILWQDCYDSSYCHL